MDISENGRSQSQSSDESAGRFTDACRQAQKSRLQAINVPLLTWYKANGRMLPWRRDSQPYHVWISEIMLQQTRIEAVIPYYSRFMQALPGVADLASVEDDRLMKLWEGLGYYSRARNLKKAAIVIMEKYGGFMPSRYEELVGLPGIGSYTAGAIASISFGKAYPAVDGNVLRVVSRILESREDILKQSTKKRMGTLLAETMPKVEAGAFNQGLMELGETLCIPKGEPKCPQCPLAEFCLSSLHGMAGQIPVKSLPKERRIEKRTVCILEYNGYIGLRKRAPTGLLASLYELPNVLGYLAKEELADAFRLEEEAGIAGERLPDARHIFSHVEWRMIGYKVRLTKPVQGYLMAKKQDLKTIYPLPNAFSRYIKLIK